MLKIYEILTSETTWKPRNHKIIQQATERISVDTTDLYFSVIGAMEHIERHQNVAFLGFLNIIN